MILIINTSEFNRLEVYLVKGGKIIAKKLPIAFNESEKLLSLIDSLIKTSSSKLHDSGFMIQSLKGVGVVTGPAGFTALRIGVTVANTLAWGLKIPVVGVARGEFKEPADLVNLILRKLKKAKPGKLVLPFYGGEPRITKSKD